MASAAAAGRGLSGNAEFTSFCWDAVFESKEAKLFYIDEWMFKV